MIEAARDALYAAGIGRETLAARLLELAAAAGAELVSERYKLCALLEASDSGLRYALKTLAAAGLIECQRSARGLVRFAVRLGARLSVPDVRPTQQALPFAEKFTTEARRHGAEKGVERLGDAASTVDSAPCLRVSEVNEDRDKALRSCAALSRDATEGVGDAPAGLRSGGKKPRVSKVVETSDLESLAARWPSLMEVADDPLAREVHSSIPIPPFPPPLAKARYSPGNRDGVHRENAKERNRERDRTEDQSADALTVQAGVSPPSRFRDPAGGNVDSHQGQGIPGVQGGKIAAWREKILARVKIDARYGWTAWSAALLAVEGPISEAVLAGCIEGAHGHGGKFVNAVKARLAECDVGKLRQLTLWDDVTRTVQLHRFTHLRPALARHGIQLDDGATRLVRTRQRA